MVRACNPAAGRDGKSELRVGRVALDEERESGREAVHGIFGGEIRGAADRLL
jgi:hypothetical protein